MNDELLDVYRATLNDVYGYLLFHVGGDRQLAEDLTAETFLHTARHFRDGRGHEVTIGWLKTVAKRRLIDHIRRQSSLEQRAERLRTELAVQASSGDSGRDDVHDALSALAPEQRLALVLKYLDGLRVAEIAERLDRTPKATESLLARARENFRRAYRSAP